MVEYPIEVCSTVSGVEKTAIKSGDHNYFLRAHTHTLIVTILSRPPSPHPSIHFTYCLGSIGDYYRSDNDDDTVDDVWS